MTIDVYTDSNDVIIDVGTDTRETPEVVTDALYGPKGEKGDKGDTGATGADGQDGEDGFSPIATVSKSGSVATITITDKNGTTTAEVYDGSGTGLVNSVNGETGDVVLTASDVGALPDTTTIPTKTSDLTNDSGFINGITNTDVITALGFTPYNSSNPNGYQANIIESIKVNGTAQTITNKSVDLTVPTKTSDLTNDDNFINNTATGDTSLGILGTIGTYSSSHVEYTEAIAIGEGSEANAIYTVALGHDAKASGSQGTAIGATSIASSSGATAIGAWAESTASHAIQIGAGTNSTANSLQIESYQLLNTSTGLIPDARLSSNIARVSQTINTLSTSGTITLTDNSINSITPSGNITFTLPTITDNTVFHEIMVQVNMATAYNIGLGTTNYFNKTAPDLSSAGTYNLYYEYDKATQQWYCGALSKGTAS